MLDAIDNLIERIKSIPKDFEEEMDAVLSEAIEFGEEKIRESMSKGISLGDPWPELSEATLRIRRKRNNNFSDKPYNNTGELLNSLEVERTKSRGWIGWSEDDERVMEAKYAMLGTPDSPRNYGRTSHIPVSQKMRKLFVFEFGLMPPGDLIKIPPRPVIRPVADLMNRKYGDKIDIRVML